MNKWDKLRVLLLATIFFAGMGVILKTIFYPSNRVITFRPLVFPKEVVLSKWQYLGSNVLENSTAVTSEYISGKRYRYIQNGQNLDIEMRYLVDTNGDVEKYFKEYTAIRLASTNVSPVLRQQENVGFYSLFVYQERAYLSACINPSGKSTVTEYQFKRNRNLYDVLSPRLILWLLSQSELLDNRCLWTNLSMPLKNAAPETVYTSLEQAWFSWYQWSRSSLMVPSISKIKSAP